MCMYVFYYYIYYTFRSQQKAEIIMPMKVLEPESPTVVAAAVTSAEMAKNLVASPVKTVAPAAAALSSLPAGPTAAEQAAEAAEGEDLLKLLAEEET